MMGWVAVVFLLYGSFLVGDRRRIGFVFQFVGNLIWAYVAVVRGFQLDLLVVNLIFAAIYVRNFFRWGLLQPRQTRRG